MPKGIPNKRYPPEFKKQVVEAVIQDGLSYQEAARIYEVQGHGRIQSWERIYKEVKVEIIMIYHENKGRYGYRRITAALRNSGTHLNHKTVQRLMKELGLDCRVRIKKFGCLIYFFKNIV